jgi:hypothetical protein
LKNESELPVHRSYRPCAAIAAHRRAARGSKRLSRRSRVSTRTRHSRGERKPCRSLAMSVNREFQARRPLPKSTRPAAGPKVGEPFGKCAGTTLLRWGTAHGGVQKLGSSHHTLIIGMRSIPFQCGAGASGASCPPPPQSLQARWTRRIRDTARKRLGGLGSASAEDLGQYLSQASRHNHRTRTDHRFARSGTGRGPQRASWMHREERQGSRSGT